LLRIYHSVCCGPIQATITIITMRKIYIASLAIWNSRATSITMQPVRLQSQPTLKKDFGEVIQFARVVPTLGVVKHLMTYKEKSFYEEKAFFVDSTFFNVFNYHFIYGNPATALKEPYSIVVQEFVANKFFGKDDPVGKRSPCTMVMAKRILK